MCTGIQNLNCQQVQGPSFGLDSTTVSKRGEPLSSPCACLLTRNFRLCFQWLPWALVLRWASVATWIRSHSSGVGSGRCCSERIISSFRLLSRFCSISLRLATRFESSRTTVHGKRHFAWQNPCNAQKLLSLVQRSNDFPNHLAIGKHNTNHV